MPSPKIFAQPDFDPQGKKFVSRDDVDMSNLEDSLPVICLEGNEQEESKVDQSWRTKNSKEQEESIVAVNHRDNGIETINFKPMNLSFTHATFEERVDFQMDTNAEKKEEPKVEKQASSPHTQHAQYIPHTQKNVPSTKKVVYSTVRRTVPPLYRPKQNKKIWFFAFWTLFVILIGVIIAVILK